MRTLMSIFLTIALSASIAMADGDQGNGGRDGCTGTECPPPPPPCCSLTTEAEDLGSVDLEEPNYLEDLMELMWDYLGFNA